MKADIVISELTVDNTGDQMLSGVILHFPEPLFPVQNTGNLNAGFERDICVMDNRTVLFLNVQNNCIAEITRIRSLTAALRKKCGLIQNDRIFCPVGPFFCIGNRLTGKHLSRKLPKITVMIVQLFCYDTHGIRFSF